MKKLLLRSLSLFSLFTAIASPAAASVSQPEPASVTVVHGIPGQDLGLAARLPVDVSLNGGCQLTGFEFGDIVGPLSLEPGNYTVEIALSGPGGPCSTTPVISGVVDLFSGEDVTVIAHLDAQGVPTVSKFVNDTSPYRFLSGRVELRHTAAAPAVDISLRKLFPFFWPDGLSLAGVENGQGAGEDLTLGLYGFQVGVSGTNVIALGPSYGFLFPGVTYRVYVVGSATTGSLTLIVEKLY